jgi:hypothetical protein
LGHCIAGYFDVLPLNIVSSESFITRGTLSGVETSMTVTVRYAVSMVFFYTDGFLIDGCAGFAFHRTGEGGFGYKISIPAVIFTTELTALFVTLRHIGEVNQLP